MTTDTVHVVVAVVLLMCIVCCIGAILRSNNDHRVPMNLDAPDNIVFLDTSTTHWFHKDHGRMHEDDCLTSSSDEDEMREQPESKRQNLDCP